MERVFELGMRVGEALVARNETVAVAESSSGGLISAALLAAPGASRYFIGGGVIYTARARHRLLGLQREALVGVRSASEPYAVILAATVRDRLGASWGLSETGAAGPTGNPYGDPAGHTCIAIDGDHARSLTIQTGVGDRAANMEAFALAGLGLLEEALGRN